MLDLFSIKKELVMPNIKSAKKRVLVIARRREENRYVKSTMATMIKKFRVAVNTNISQAEAMLRDIISYIDSARCKGVIHANNASRKVSRLNLMLNKAKANAVQAKEEVETISQVEEKETAKKATKTTKKATKKEEQEVVEPKKKSQAGKKTAKKEEK